MVAQIELLESQDPTPLGFCLWGWMKSEGYKRKDTRNELLARIRGAAACVRKREDQLRRTTRNLGTRVAKCTEVDGGDFRTPIVHCNRFVT
jgi:hypothetical protein